MVVGGGRPALRGCGALRGAARCTLRCPPLPCAPHKQNRPPQHPKTQTKSGGARVSKNSVVASRSRGVSRAAVVRPAAVSGKQESEGGEGTHNGSR